MYYVGSVHTTVYIVCIQCAVHNCVQLYSYGSTATAHFTLKCHRLQLYQSSASIVLHAAASAHQRISTKKQQSTVLQHNEKMHGENQELKRKRLQTMEKMQKEKMDVFGQFLKCLKGMGAECAITHVQSGKVVTIIIIITLLHVCVSRAFCCNQTAMTE